MAAGITKALPPWSNGAMKAAMDSRRGAVLVATAALLWSSSGLFIKILPLGALQIAGVRSLVAGLVLVAVIAGRGRLSALRLGALGWACASAYAGVLICFVAATKLTTAANAIFLQFSAPIYLVFLEPRLFNRRLQTRDLVVVGLTLAGMSLFFLGRLQGGRLAGNLLGVGSGLCLALFTLTLKLMGTRNPGRDPIGAIALGNLLVAALCAPFALPGLRPTLPQGAILLYLGAFQIALAYLLFNAGMRRLSATVAVVTGTLEAVFNPIWVFLGTGERPSGWALLGGAIILGVIGWVGFGRKGEAG